MPLLSYINAMATGVEELPAKGTSNSRSELSSLPAAKSTCDSLKSVRQVAPQSADDITFKVSSCKPVAGTVPDPNKSIVAADLNRSTRPAGAYSWVRYSHSRAFAIELSIVNAMDAVANGNAVCTTKDVSAVIGLPEAVL